jgi:hypothetical protein
MRILLTLLLFTSSLFLMSIGWHDHRFPETALALGWKWWCMISGLFIYMAAWNGWDQYRREARDPLSMPSSISLWWFSLTMAFPILGLAVPIMRLLIMAIAVQGLAPLIEHLR